MGLIKEFKAFAVKGNMIDMAVGIVIGAGFGKIVSALVDKIVMPLIGLLGGGSDFTKYDYVLKPEIIDDADKVTQEAITLGVGTFVTTVIDFAIIAFAIFIVVKMINTAKARFEEEEAKKPTVPSDEIKLLTEIRDALASK